MSIEGYSGGSAVTDRPEWLKRYRFGLRMTEQGTILSIGDGIAWVRGLPSAAMDEILDFEDGSKGLVFRLTRDRIGTILLRQESTLSAGATAHLSGRRLDIPVGEALRGRVIDPLGSPLDGGPAPDCRSRRDLDVPSPPIVSRDFVSQPLYTGVKIVDSLIPIGRGQRQLIIGDNGVGKTSLAIDTVIRQRDQDVYCIYVLIGQKRSEVVRTIEALTSAGAMTYTTVVVAEAAATPGLKYLAPFAGCAVAESRMMQGGDTLVVYDDLTTHARTYRELSLLLRRSPGREAYPGDIFYLHSRLLERSTRLRSSHGGGSMTALPIVETEQGEIATYIPTNLISITDGQIYLDRKLFASGRLPAIDVSRSVSRIGGNAQHPRIKEEAGRMKLDYLQFMELEVFTRFGTRMEKSVELKIRRGRALREILKQERFSPLSAEAHMAWLVAFNEGFFDALDPSEIATRLAYLEKGVSKSEMKLTHPRDEWVRAAGRWMNRGDLE
jgi:F-type H+-transporting ATPase subunit alpha